MSILEEAQKITYGDREQTYGDPARNLRQIADLWTTYLNLSIKDAIRPEDVANMMILLKIARLKTTPAHLDSLTDIAGYAALIERIQKVSVDNHNIKLIPEPEIVKHIRIIDSAAADWVMGNVPIEKLIGCEDYFSPNTPFMWKTTPQGYHYWLRIYGRYYFLKYETSPGQYDFR